MTKAYTATLRETHPVDVEVPEAALRSVQGALRLNPRESVQVTDDEANAIAASGYACDLEPIAPAEEGAALAAPSPTALPTPFEAPDEAESADAESTGDSAIPKPARKRLAQ